MSSSSYAAGIELFEITLVYQEYDIYHYLPGPADYIILIYPFIIGSTEYLANFFPWFDHFSLNWHSLLELMGGINTGADLLVGQVRRFACQAAGCEVLPVPDAKLLVDAPLRAVGLVQAESWTCLSSFATHAGLRCQASKSCFTMSNHHLPIGRR